MHYVSDCLWQYYACWYLWMRQVIESGPSASKAAEAEDAARFVCEACSPGSKRSTTQAAAYRDARKHTIETTLKRGEYRCKPAGGPRYSLTESALRPFDEPNDPIVAIGGPAMQRLNTWQEIDALPCRLSNAVATGAAWQTHFGGDATGPGGIHSDLLLESILQPSNDSDKIGMPPTVWGGNPWVPLFLLWRATWQSDYPWEGDIASNLVNSRWTLARHKNADSAPDLALINTAVRPAPADYATYQGRAILTSSGAKSLRDALASVKRDHPLINTLNNRPVMSQALDGLHEALARRLVGTPPASRARTSQQESPGQPSDLPHDAFGRPVLPDPRGPVENPAPLRGGRFRADRHVAR